MNRKGNTTWTLKGYLGHDLSTAIDIFIVTMQVVIPFCLHLDNTYGANSELSDPFDSICKGLK